MPAAHTQQNLTQVPPLPRVSMAANTVANAGIIKAIVIFYRASSIRIRHSSDTEAVFRFVMTVQALQKHFVSFLGLKELSLKYGLGEFEIKIYHKVLEPGGKSDNFVVTTDEQWKLEPPNTLDDTGSEMNSMYF